MRKENSQTLSTSFQSLINCFNFKEKGRQLVYWFLCHRWCGNPGGRFKESAKVRPPEGEIINVYVRVHHYPTSYSQESFKFREIWKLECFFSSIFFSWVSAQCTVLCKRLLPGMLQVSAQNLSTLTFSRSEHKSLS